MKNKFIPVIISGGSSSRLFPLSRELTPKPFLTLLNNSNNGTLFYNTVQRCLLLNPDELYTVTLQDLAELTLDELDKLSKKDYDSVTFNFILENKGFDTAAAFTFAILDCYLRNPDAIMLILPSDHVIKNDESFVASVEKAKKYAANDRIAIFGITPDKPDIGFGYIEKGKPIEKSVSGVSQFKEKPNLELATEFVKSGNYLWNSGMVCAKASTLYNELIKFNNELLVEVVSLYDNSMKSLQSVLVNYPDDFKFKLPFDKALLEKTDNLVVVQCDNLQWTDVGSWDALKEEHVMNKDDNCVIKSNRPQYVNLLKSKNCYVNASASTKKVISVIGLEDIIVVDTDDCLLIMSPNNSSDVKTVVNELKKTEFSNVLRDHSTKESLSM